MRSCSQKHKDTSQKSQMPPQTFPEALKSLQNILNFRDGKSFAVKIE